MSRVALNRDDRHIVLKLIETKQSQASGRDDLPIHRLVLCHGIYRYILQLYLINIKSFLLTEAPKDFINSYFNSPIHLYL